MKACGTTSALSRSMNSSDKGRRSGGVNGIAGKPDFVCAESLGLPHDVPYELLDLEGEAPTARTIAFDGTRRFGYPGPLSNQPDREHLLCRYRPLPPGKRYSRPPIYRHDPARCFILMKDLGDTDLWSLRNHPGICADASTKRPSKSSTASTPPGDALSVGEVRLMEAFGPSLYRWERGIFQENFIRHSAPLSSSRNSAAGSKPS